LVNETMMIVKGNNISGQYKCPGKLEICPSTAIE